MSLEELKSNIESALEADDDLIFNTFQEINSYNGQWDDDAWYDMDMIGEILADDSDPLYLVYRFFYGSSAYNENQPANPNDSYFRLNGYGNVETADSPGFVMNQVDKYWASEIASYIVDNLDESFDLPSEIQELVDEYNENPEE